MYPMTFFDPSETGQDQRARAAQLIAEAMGRDVEEQSELIAARARSRMDVAHWERGSYEAETQQLEEERHRLRHQAQYAMIQVYLAIERIRVELARSRALLGRNQNQQAR